MANDHVDYLKERIKQNQELIRMLTTFIVGFSIFVATGFMEFDLINEFSYLSNTIRFAILWFFLINDIVFIYVL